MTTPLTQKAIDDQRRVYAYDAGVVAISRDLLMHLLDIAEDHARLVAVVAEYEHSICWDTTCSGCAAVLDKSYEAYCDERHDELVTERDTLRAEVERLKDELNRYHTD